MMHPLPRTPRALAASLALLLAACGSKSDSGLTGAYRFADGTLATLVPRSDGGYRYRNLTTGDARLFQDDGPPGQLTAGPGWNGEGPPAVSLQVERAEGAPPAGLWWTEPGRARLRAERVALHEEEVEFASGGTTLRGKLVRPLGKGPFPAVVLVHGSERTPATPHYHEPYAYAAQGIATLVYDKRGTGSSDGDFTMNFDQLAGDAAAAFRWLRARPETDTARVGLAGFSQGGWIAPLAARRAPGAAFVLVAYGLAESPLAEDRNEALLQLRSRGTPPADLAKAEEVVASVHAVLRSGLRDGWDRLADVRGKYNSEPWYSLLGGDVTESFARYPTWAVRRIAPSRMHGMSWSYEPEPVLAETRIPMLWLLGGSDTEAPIEGTLEVLRRLRSAGQPITIQVYPEAEHGMINVSMVDGKRVLTRHPAGYFALQASWMRAQRLHSPAPDSAAGAPAAQR